MPIKIATRDSTFFVSGSIDESASFASLLNSEIRQINWRDVSGINSFGVGQLLEAVQNIAKRKLIFIECPVMLMDAFVMIPALIGSDQNVVKIQSFFVPYDCEPCDKEVKVLVNAKEIRVAANVLSAPEQHCPKCKKVLVMNDEAQNYIELSKRGVF